MCLGGRAGHCGGSGRSPLGPQSKARKECLHTLSPCEHMSRGNGSLCRPGLRTFASM